jgi:hypothetical protein
MNISTCARLAPHLDHGDVPQNIVNFAIATWLQSVPNCFSRMAAMVFFHKAGQVQRRRAIDPGSPPAIASQIATVWETV